MRALIVVIAFAACGRSATAPALGENVELPLGASVQFPSDTANLTFTDVTADSRCPSNVQCVWAGEAVTVFTAGGSRQLTLTLGPDASKATAMARGYQVTLVALKPYPTSTGMPVKSDYVATVLFTSAKD